MFRLHLESSKKRNPLFHLTEDAWNLASKRHPELSSKIDVSIGWDGDILEKSLNDAQGIIVGPLNKELIAKGNLIAEDYNIKEQLKITQTSR